MRSGRLADLQGIKRAMLVRVGSALASRHHVSCLKDLLLSAGESGGASSATVIQSSQFTAFRMPLRC